MPEGPEVRKVTDFLNKYKNKSLNKIIINSGRYNKHGPFKGYNQLSIDLPLKIIDINCKGKFIYIIFENNMVLFNTLGMSGRWINSKEKHNNLTFEFNELKTSLYFNDYRNFGTFMYQTKDDLDKKLKELGPDILQDFNNYDLFRERIERKRSDTLIGSALLDQKVAAGCGNYLRAETLYESKINPHREIKDLSEKELKLIWSNMVKIGWIFYDYEKGIKNNILNKNDKLIKKYVISDYQDYYYYMNFQIYSREKDKKNNKIIKEKMGTRTIHWVPKVQK